MQTISSTFGPKSNVDAAHWKKFVVESRTDIEHEVACKALVKFEAKHFSAFDENSNTCHLGLWSKEAESKPFEGDANNINVEFNLDLLNPFRDQTFFKRHSHLYAPFIYKTFTGTKNTQHCAMHCYFDATLHCEFNFISNGICYLGNFNTQSAIGSTSGSFNVYIFSGKVLYSRQHAKLKDDINMESVSRENFRISMDLQVLKKLKAYLR